MKLRNLLLVTLLAIVFTTTAQNHFILNGNDKIDLRGEWNLVMGEFLSHEEILRNPQSIKAEVPGTWNNLIWNNKSIGPFGYGTYYTTIVINQNFSNSLAIEVSEVSLAYKLFVDDELIGQLGIPGKNKTEEIPKIDYEIFDFNPTNKDSVTIIFHVSNFSHESGGLWYAPTMGDESQLRQDYDFNKAVKLLILGSIIISGIFQLYIFLRRRKEKFALYFFLICVSLALLTISRGDMPIMDFFPSTSWHTLKKIVYISIFLIVPTNALFLRELYPDYFPKKIVVGTAILSLLLILFTLIVSPRISYVVIPSYHIYNLIIGIYLFISLCRAAYNNNFGARFLLTGYIFGFVMAIHDILRSQYLIEGFNFDMIHVGTLIYIFQLIAVIAGRYITAVEGREQLSTHLRKVNDELEATITRRTKKLKEQNQIIESQNIKLQEAIEEKNDLMSVVAHDLKAPFDSINSLSDIMKPKLDESLLEFNQMIKKLTSNGKYLIEHLTQLGYYEQDDFNIHLERFSLEEFFNQKNVSFQKLASEKGVNLKSSLSLKNKDFTSDKSLIDRILDNILSNAIKFSPTNKDVHFELIEDNQLEIRINDQGPGFTPEDKKKAFGKFQKLSAKPTGGESSTGLGLSIVKMLVEKLNGNIEIISEHCNGAEIIVIIPKSEL